jgi:hypothetical protein
MINSLATLARDPKTGSVDALNHTPGNGGKRVRLTSFRHCPLTIASVAKQQAK